MTRKSLIICTNPDRYAKYLSEQRGFALEAAQRKARAFVDFAIVNIANRFWLDDNDELELRYADNFPIWHGEPQHYSTHGTRFVAYSSDSVREKARELDSRIVLALHTIKPPRKSTKTRAKNWPRPGTIAHDVLAYLRDCKTPVPEWNVRITIAYEDDGAIEKCVHHALLKLLERELVYITPTRVKSVVRRGFVAKGSPADARVPADAPRYNEWL